MKTKIEKKTKHIFPFPRIESLILCAIKYIRAIDCTVNSTKTLTHLFSMHFFLNTYLSLPLLWHLRMYDVYCAAPNLLQITWLLTWKITVEAGFWSITIEARNLSMCPAGLSLVVNQRNAKIYNYFSNSLDDMNDLVKLLFFT